MTHYRILREMFQGGAAKSRALALLLADVAKRQSVDFVDLGKITQVDPVDGVHLTTEAHTDIAAAMAVTVRDIWK